MTIPRVVYFDGLCEANPGGWMAWAFVALAADGAEIARGGKVSPPQAGNTNNFAEYQGLITALDWLGRHEHHGVLVRGDSQLVINQVSGLWQVNSPALRELWREATRMQVATGAILQWVPREKNWRADAAGRALLPPEARAVVEASERRRAAMKARRA